MKLAILLFLASFSSQLDCSASNVHITLGDYFSDRRQAVTFRVGVMLNSSKCQKKLRLHYLAPSGEKLEFEPSECRDYSLPKGDYERTFCFFDLEELPDAGEFFYSIALDRNLVKGPFSFKSKVYEGPDLSIVTFGDHDLAFGKDTIDRLAKTDYDLLVMVGDIAYDIEDENGLRGDRYFEEMERFFATRPVVIIAGNHENIDKGRMFASRFKYPMSATPDENSVIAFSVGQLLFFGVNFDFAIQLHEEKYFETLQKLQNELHRLTSAFPSYRRVFFAHRPFVRANQKEKMYEAHSLIHRLKPFEDLVHRFDVKFHLFGHVHSYERYSFVFNYEIEKNGDSAIAIVGSGGNHEVRDGYKFPQPFVQKAIFLTPEFLLVQSKGTFLVCSFIESKTGNVLDRFNLQKSITSGNKLVLFAYLLGLGLAISLAGSVLLGRMRKSRLYSDYRTEQESMV